MATPDEGLRRAQSRQGRRMVGLEHKRLPTRFARNQIGLGLRMPAPQHVNTRGRAARHLFTAGVAASWEIDLQARLALARRAARQVRVVQYVREVEVASIALQLRRERRSIEKLLNLALKAGDVEQVSTLHSCLHKTREQLLRIAQVPNPPGGRAGRGGRGMIDLQSVLDLVPGAPEE